MATRLTRLKTRAASDPTSPSEQPAAAPAPPKPRPKQRKGFAVTEQPLTVSRARLLAVAGRVDDACLGEIRGWVRDFVGAH